MRGEEVRNQFHEDKGLILREVLAIDRTRLANERTLLAYVRSSLVIGASSVSVLRLFPTNQFLLVAAIVGLPIAVLLLVIGGTKFLQLQRTLARVRTERPQRSDPSDQAIRRPCSDSNRYSCGQQP